MTSWDISPDGVRAVLGRTEAVAAEFETQMSDLDAAIVGAAAQSSSTIVAEALSGYAASARADFAFIFTRTGACLTGAANATSAYVEDDQEMAAHAQAAASASPDLYAGLPRAGGAVPR
jgi:hypothetical protein